MSTTENETAINRRVFFKTCASAMILTAAHPQVLAQKDKAIKRYFSVRLTHANGTPITSKDLKKNESYIFHYPFITTPCFLINLQRSVNGGSSLATEDNQIYQWQGGVGPDNSVVAFSAICAHKMSYPTPSLSFINFRSEAVSYTDKNKNHKKQKQLIYCCSERSAYDPAKGAQVVGGPAPQPLTTIVLEHDQQKDHYYATGTLGGEMYDRFFEEFEFRLALDNKIEDVKMPAQHTSAIYHHLNYSKSVVSCK